MSILVPMYVITGTNLVPGVDLHNAFKQQGM